MNSAADHYYTLVPVRICKLAKVSARHLGNSITPVRSFYIFSAYSMANRAIFTPTPALADRMQCSRKGLHSLLTFTGS